MRGTLWTASIPSRRMFRRIAVASVSFATLFGLVGAGTAAAETAVPTHASPTVSAALTPSQLPGPCNLGEVGPRGVGPDARPYVSVPCDPAGKAGTEDEAQRLNSLASDPAYGGRITARSMQAAQAALGLEKLGLLLAPVRRDSTGAADFIDGRGRSWDAKTVNSRFVAHQGGYDLARSMTKIGLELLLGANVIFVTENLSAEAVSELKTAVDSAGLGSRVLFWPAGVIAAGAVPECG